MHGGGSAGNSIVDGKTGLKQDEEINGTEKEEEKDADGRVGHFRRHDTRRRSEVGAMIQQGRTECRAVRKAQKVKVDAKQGQDGWECSVS